MQKFISIQEALNKKKGKVSLRGWVYRERGSNKFKFIVLRDSSNIIQCVIKKENITKKEWEDADKLLIESSLELEGTLKEDKRAPTGYELDVLKLNVIHFSETYPITKDQSPEHLMDNRHLWIRSRKITAVMKIKSTIMEAFREFYRKQKYHEFTPPILQPSQCEGGSTLFEVKYYKDKTYLTQSWQLYAEAGIFALEKIFAISPCFRAEKSKTSRHLSEFLMAEMEAAWMSLNELTKSAEECVSFIVQEVLKKHKEDLKLLGRDVKKLEKIKAPFPRLTYTEALDLLEKKSKMKVKWGKDLRTMEEDEIVKHFDKPVIVTHYPKEIMAFYKPKDPEDEKTALCFDMLAPEGYGEIIGGSQRDIDIKELEKSLKKQGEKIEDYSWYFDLRKYGSVPHSGYGLGVERITAWICGTENIKETTPFPRTMLRWKP
jgi:asparaginyl-tRNA synthetase